MATTQQNRIAIKDWIRLHKHMEVRNILFRGGNAVKIRVSFSPFEVRLPIRTPLKHSMLMRFVVPFIATFLVAATANSESLPEKYAEYGTLIVTPFKTAPYPHPVRAAGHYYKTNFFSAKEHYSDSTVALFVPKDFQRGRKIDFVVHFHGWGNNVSRALDKYRLIEQFSVSGKNAILIVPQGPYNASDSFDGKLEDPNGFARFMAEAVSVLETKANIPKPQLGKIILSGHSGGYQVISSILDVGGLTDHIQEVWLFDALYGRTEKFSKWFETPKSISLRFVDLYTDHGGTKEETEKLMADLKKKKLPHYFAEEKDATPNALTKNKLVFLHTDNSHDVVMQQNDTFESFLRTSHLPAILNEQQRAATVSPKLQ
jgi:hypothetical protein